MTPLHFAAKYGNMNVAKLLLQKDSKLDAQDKVGLLVSFILSNFLPSRASNKNSNLMKTNPSTI